MSDDKPLEPWMCGAQLRKKPGIYCRKAKMKGKERCRLHGGLTPVAHESASFRHGRYSKHMPENLIGRYAEAMADADMLSLAPEIATVTALIGSRLEAVNAGASVEAWKEAREKLRELRQAIVTTKDAAAMMKALGELDSIAAKGNGQRRAERELAEALDWRAKLVHKEWRRQVDLRAVMTIYEAQVLVTRVHEIILRHVTDRPILAAISAELSSALSHTTSGAAGVKGPG